MHNRVLIVDNGVRDSDLKAGIGEMQADEAGSARDILPLCLVNEYEFVFIDLDSGDGFLWNALRKIKGNSDIYGSPCIIALSESGKPPKRNIPCFDVLVGKPFNTNELIAAIEGWRAGGFCRNAVVETRTDSMKYHVGRIKEDFKPDAQEQRMEWAKVEIASLECWPWNRSEIHPHVDVKMLWSKKRFYARFQVKEDLVLARMTEFQSPVCRDSCVELFVSPLGKEYFNFEVNCIGTLLVQYGKDRRNRIELPLYNADGIVISTSFPMGKAIPVPTECPRYGYVVEYSIPFSLFEKYSGTGTPKEGDVWKGNFYKCADDVLDPQWGSWAPVKTPRPDFHRPEFFGELVFIR